MNEQIRLLQAEIRADMQAIAEVYTALHAVRHRLTEPEISIVVGYYLHVLYGLFESLFTRIATTFGNHLTDTAQWHAQLLRRMHLDVEGIRPRVINTETSHCLDELRRFRHVFRSAYVLCFDPERLGFILKYVERLEALYESDLQAFLRFLDDLAL